MKTSNYLLMVCLLAIAAATTLAGFMRASARRPEQPSVLSKIVTDARDVWSAADSDQPPFAPGAALRVACEYVRRVPLPDYTDAWVFESLTLHRMSVSPDAKAAQEWVYLANFKTLAHVVDDTDPVSARLQIPVRFDGTVPPGIVKRIP